MRSAVLLVLLVTLMFTDAGPCQEQNNNGYYKFERKHILSYDFDRSNPKAWENYLTYKGLCKRTKLQSFLEKDDEYSVKGICDGQGIRYRGIRDNLCISTETFRVYTVQSTKRNNRCVVQSLQQIERYVVVACDVDGNQCLPVHYQTQTNEPPQGVDICQPLTYRPRYRGEKWLLSK